MKKFFLGILVTLLLISVACAVIFIVLFINSQNEIQRLKSDAATNSQNTNLNTTNNDLTVNENSNSLDYKIAEKNTSNTEAAYDLDVTYPFLEITNSESKIKSGIESFNEFIETKTDGFISMITLSPASPGAQSNYTVVTYRVLSSNNKSISGIFDMEFYTGGAHPNTTYISFNFDLEEEKPIEITDLLKESNDLADLSEMAKQKVIEKLNEQSYSDEDITEMGMLDDGTKPILLNYQMFAFDEEKIYIYFPPYQVAPYALGSFEIEISRSELNGIVSEKY